MDIDHLHTLVVACLEEGERTNDTGPAHDALVAYLDEVRPRIYICVWCGEEGTAPMRDHASTCTARPTFGGRP